MSESPQARTLPRTPGSRAFLCAAVAIVLLGVAPRAYHLGWRSLWIDEAIAANVSRGTLAQTLALTRGLHSAPIVDPLILYAVEKVSAGPLAVRTPSLVASVLAIVIMLYLATIPSVDRKTALLAALLLSVSAAQIRYAQEVREYSLGVMYATLLLYFFISYTSGTEERRARIGLYSALFVAPFIQYGLVLFAFGILAALFILAIFHTQAKKKIVETVEGALFLGMGGVLSFFLTLRYQWGEKAWYLEDSYFHRGSSLPAFVLSNTHHIFTFLLPGLAAALISAVAISLHVVWSVRARAVSPVVVLALTSFGITLICATFRVYPYGAIRQCLFLAPVLCLLAAESCVQSVNHFAGHLKALGLTAIVGVVIISGAVQIRSMAPYAEVEAIQGILAGLRSHIEPGDGVYVYSGAVPAVDFYIKERDERFTYGDFHRDVPREYVPEILANLRPGTTREWIIFSHIYASEDRIILSELSDNWEVEPVLFTKGCGLYLAHRRPDFASETLAGGKLDDGQTTLDLRHDSFLDWNLRNSRKTGP